MKVDLRECFEMISLIDIRNKMMIYFFLLEFLLMLMYSFWLGFFEFVWLVSKFFNLRYDVWEINIVGI